MAKKKVKENIRVEVYPYMRYSGVDVIDEQIINKCKEVVKLIEKHLDDYIDRVNIEWDIKSVCEFCGSKWEWKEGEEPCCCKEAMKEFNSKKGGDNR